MDARVGGENFVINRTGVSNPISHSSKIFAKVNVTILPFWCFTVSFRNSKTSPYVVTERRIIDPTCSQIVQDG